MMRFSRPALRGLALLALLLGQIPLHAQVSPPPSSSASADDPPAQSALTDELFYELLLGELNANSGDPTAGYSLMLDAANKAKDPRLFQRAVEMALQLRSPEAALRAANAWSTAIPNSREANRYVLQILIGTNKGAESVDALRKEIASSTPMERNASINAIPRAYGRLTDRKMAAEVVEKALADYLQDKTTGASAWTTVGRMRLAAGDTAGALEAARRGQAVEADAEGPAMLAMEMMDAKQPAAEAIVRQYMQGKPTPAMRLAYVRAQLDDQRYAEATQQLQKLTTDQPDFAEAWLVLGTLQVQDNQLDAAEASLKKFLALPPVDGQNEQRSRATAQAYLSLAQVAEKRKDYKGAENWLNQIENSDDLLSAQTRRASLLARQGKMTEARALIKQLPERNPAEARLKLNAEVQLLRDAKQYQPAYDLLKAALEKDPKDGELMYDQAMMAEKLNRVDEMESILRALIAAKPDYQHAYNALGYSLADRNVKLPEAKQLIQKAIELVPGDPYIADSLGWVEFRMGNNAEALRILDAAYKAKPDAEIAAHLGEVLWAMGQRDRATAIFKEGMALNGENETLVATVKRLRVKL